MKKQKIFFACTVISAMVLFFIMGLWISGKTSSAQLSCNDVFLIGCNGAGCTPVCPNPATHTRVGGVVNGKQNWRIGLCIEN